MTQKFIIVKKKKKKVAVNVFSSFVLCSATVTEGYSRILTIAISLTLIFRLQGPEAANLLVVK